MSGRSSWWHPRVLGAWLSLTVHLLAVSGVAQAAVTVLAVFEGSHHIGVRAHGQGTVLVLSHDRPGSACREARQHRIGRTHSPVLTAVMWLAQPNFGDRDHVFALTTGSSQFSRIGERLVRPLLSVPVYLAVQQSPGPTAPERPLQIAATDSIPSYPLLVIDSVVLLI